MSDSSILLPDIGPGFLRTLNLAAFYSEQVHVFTLTSAESARNVLGLVKRGELYVALHSLSSQEWDEILGDGLDEEELDEDGDTDLEEDGSVKGFFDFTVENETVLSLARSEGVVHSITEQVIADMVGHKERIEAGMGMIRSGLAGLEPMTRDGEVLLPGFQSSVGEVASSLPSVVEWLYKLAVSMGSVEKAIPDEAMEKLNRGPDVLQRAAIGSYYMLAAMYSLSTGSGGVTWCRSVQECFDACSKCLMEGMESVNELLVRQDSTVRRLGQLVLVEEVPNVADLPFEAILDIRRSRRPELLAFREGLRQLAADVDPAMDSKALEHALRAKIDRQFRPAMRDLRNSISESRERLVTDLFHPGGCGSALIPAAISLLAGAGPDLAAIVGAIGGIAGKAYEFMIGKKLSENSMRRNSWSILVDIENRAGMRTPGRGRS